MVENFQKIMQRLWIIEEKFKENIEKFIENLNILINNLNLFLNNFYDILGKFFKDICEKFELVLK